MELQKLSRTVKVYKKKQAGDEKCIGMTKMRSSREEGDQNEAGNAGIL